jgi:hypothetical protein
MNKLKSIGAALPTKVAAQETMARMVERYATAGTVSGADLVRVLGDPIRGIGLKAMPPLGRKEKL